MQENKILIKINREKRLHYETKNRFKKILKLLTLITMYVSFHIYCNIIQNTINLFSRSKRGRDRPGQIPKN